MEVRDIKPEWFRAFAYLTDEGINELTLEQRKRMEPKLDMVSRIAHKMAMNMLRGTVKYDNDDWTVMQWLEYLKNNSIDSLSYTYLLEQAMINERWIDS